MTFSRHWSAGAIFSRVFFSSVQYDYAVNSHSTTASKLCPAPGRDGRNESLWHRLMPAEEEDYGGSPPRRIYNDFFSFKFDFKETGNNDSLWQKIRPENYRCSMQQ